MPLGILFIIFFRFRNTILQNQQTMISQLIFAQKQPDFKQVTEMSNIVAPTTLSMKHKIYTDS